MCLQGRKGMQKDCISSFLFPWPLHFVLIISCSDLFLICSAKHITTLGIRSWIGKNINHIYWRVWFISINKINIALHIFLYLQTECTIIVLYPDFIDLNQKKVHYKYQYMIIYLHWFCFSNCDSKLCWSGTVFVLLKK